METIRSGENLKPGQLRKEKIPYNFHISDFQLLITVRDSEPREEI